MKTILLPRRAAALKRAGLMAGASLLPAMASAAPITFNTALPVSTGQWLIREQYMQLLMNDATTVPDLNVHADAFVNVVAYGVNDRLALFAMAPWYLDKTLRVTTPMGRVNRSDAGIGDTQLIARYTFLQHDAPGQTFRVAALAGVIAPTGSSNKADRYGPLPRPFQNGTGAWGGLGGVVATYQTLNWEADADATYQATGIHDGYRTGPVSEIDGSFQYRLWPRRLGSGVPGFLYSVLETNLTRTGHDRMNGMDVAESGGTQWFVSPGLQFVTMNYVLETAVQLPIMQSMSDHALRDRYILHIGFRAHFQ